MKRRDLSVVLQSQKPIEHNVLEFKPIHASRILKQVKINRIPFDASNSDHRLAYAIFAKSGRWTMQFEIEPPDLDAVKTIQRKLIEHAISAELVNADNIVESFSKANARSN